MFTHFLKNLILKISIPFSIPYVSGLFPFLSQMESSIPLRKILEALRKMPFLRAIVPSPSGKPQKSRESLILDFWQAVEYFSVKHIPKLASFFKPGEQPLIEQVFPYIPGQPLPWDPNHWICRRLKEKGQYYDYAAAPSPSSSNPNQPVRKSSLKFLRFKVFGGIYSDRLIRETLERKCGKDDDDVDVCEKFQDGDACAYFFNVTDDGRPLLDSFILPTCAWALGRTINPGPQDRAWFNDFTVFEAQMKQSFKEHFAIEDDDVIGQDLKPFNVGRVITPDHLMAFTQKMIQSLGIESVVKDLKIRFGSFYCDQKPKLPGNGRYEIRDAEFLNSFFIDDLGKISRLLNGPSAAANRGAGLQQFLTPEKKLNLKKRVDVRRNRRKILSSLAPSQFPSGCWPTKGHRPLATSQQFAVNEIAAASHKAGIMAVNGPPGTGKTTLLRDLISFIVVERAKAVSLLKKPSDAFEGKESWKVDEYTRTISLWKPEFKGFEIVVASSNNGAVQNVTSEIPGESAIDEFWLPKIDYFTDLATRFLGKRAWGLMAAQLGSKSNCWEFQGKLWADPKEPKNQKKAAQEEAIADFSKAASSQAGRKANPPPDQQIGLSNLLKSFCSQSIDWQAATASFNEALEFEKEKRAEAETIYQIFQQAAQLHEKPWWVPGFLWRWAPFQKFFRSLFFHKKRLQNLQKRLFEKLEGVSLESWLQDEEIRELSLPWLTPQWLQARAEVFIEAMKLHKAFIIANAQTIRNNLHVAVDVLLETVSSDASPAAISAAWTSLFFVVPVVSTTFASFSRQFSLTGQEGLGWLLIDEAGQALPQAAVGAIWRSKRIVVVGDPMQLKPVITLSKAAQKTLQTHFYTEATWLPGKTSVQELADRVCSLGTTIEYGEGRQWVGMPLRVHRRCEKLEFTLSNKISYGELMIFGTPPRPSLTLPKSRWINIFETVNHDHWIPEEGEVAIKLVSKLVREGTATDSIYIISPFRTVADGLKRAFKDAPYQGLKIGTIHITQGKEGDVVILVLGGNPKKPGAKKWASEEPNLLNVAATRAKRRFYIIGNQDEWGRYPFFRDASALFASHNEEGGDEDIWRHILQISGGG